jgi:excisionase family DNA binding protein
VKDAAERIGVSVKTVMRLVDTGSIPIYRIGPGGRLRKFAEEDVIAYLRKCRKIGRR